MWYHVNQEEWVQIHYVHGYMTRGRERLSLTYQALTFPAALTVKNRQKTWRLTSSFLNILVSGLQGTWLTCNLSLFGLVSWFLHVQDCSKVYQKTFHRHWNTILKEIQIRQRQNKICIFIQIIPELQFFIWDFICSSRLIELFKWC